MIVHHLMHAEPSAMSLKSGDNWAVPLCPQHHLELHDFADEPLWWALIGIDAMKVAQKLWAAFLTATGADDT